MQPITICLCAALLFAHTAAAQLTCWNQGSQRVGAVWERGPDLACALAPGWPWWHLYTPAHRAVVTRPGFRLGEAQALPALLVHYRCTGFLLLPVVVDRVRTLGYALDVAEQPCVPSQRLTP